MMIHKSDCPASDDSRVRTFRGHRGDQMARCKECAALSVVDEPDPLPDLDEPDLLPDLDQSRYRCRAHPEQPVTWKGAGCPDCPKRRDRRRRRPRPAETEATR